jgi:hypothetical protein
VTNWASLRVEELGELILVDSTKVHQPEGVEEVHKCLFQRAILLFHSAAAPPSSSYSSLRGIPLLRWLSSSSLPEDTQPRLISDGRVMISDIVLATPNVTFSEHTDPISCYTSNKIFKNMREHENTASAYYGRVKMTRLPLR